LTTTSAKKIRQAGAQAEQTPCLLDVSYLDLQDDVDSLTRELKLAKLARHREFVERERLGNRMIGALNALPGAVLILDGGGIICEKNGKASRLFKQPLLGSPWSDVARREFCSADGADGDLRLHDGRWFNLSRQPLGTEPGEILLLTDVSESRRMADLMQRRERLSLVGEMTAALAHQIRTPLTSALLYVGQFGTGLHDEQTLAVKVSDRLTDLVHLVDDMLLYAGSARRGGETFSVAELFHDVQESVELRTDDYPLRIASLRTPLNVTGNRDAIRRALNNLVDNARQACGDAARIELGAELVDGKVCLTVSDNGHGVPEEIRERLFEPFFTTRPQGTGLGLAVVRAVATVHDGEVLVDSGARGTTFALCLPVSGQN